LEPAVGERAECVMLNKGPHLVEAVRVLDDILCRMEAHQSKKSARLRRLHLSSMLNSQPDVKSALNGQIDIHANPKFIQANL
jgi:pyruvate kinase